MCSIMVVPCVAPERWLGHLPLREVLPGSDPGAADNEWNAVQCRPALVSSPDHPEENGRGCSTAGAGAFALGVGRR